MAPFLCKNEPVKKDNWGCHDNRVQQAGCAALARRTSNGIKAPPRLVEQLWFELAAFQLPQSLFKFKINMEHPFPKKKKKVKQEKRTQKVLIQTGLKIWISLETIILSVSSQCCPEGWQADQWALCSLRKPAASQRPVDQVIKTLLPLLLVIKYFHAFVNTFSSFNPAGHKKHNFRFIGRPNIRRSQNLRAAVKYC